MIKGKELKKYHCENKKKINSYIKNIELLVCVFIMVFTFLAVGEIVYSHYYDNCDRQKEETKTTKDTMTATAGVITMLNELSFNDKMIILTTDNKTNIVASHNPVKEKFDMKRYQDEEELKKSDFEYTYDHDKMYSKVASLKVRSSVSTIDDSNVICKISYSDMVEVLGRSTYDKEWSYVKVNNKKQGFVSSKYLSKTKVELKQHKKANAPTTHDSVDYTWNGEVLNRRNGHVFGPNGWETYYNLDMSGVIAIMRRMGYNYNYWVRNDGVKMYGNYVMVAARIDENHPRGRIVQTTLGTGMVCDTGEFVYTTNNTFDIAVTW